jgi:hypothetical protein
MKKAVSQLMLKKYVNYKYQLPEYNPNATFDWIKNQSGLPWLQLGVEIPFKEILNELESIQSLLVSHRDGYGEHSGWKSFCIHGKSFDATREDEHYNDSRPHIWTPEAKQYLPKTVEYFIKWPSFDFTRLRVMLLEPGGYVSIHSDSNKSALMPVNIAITQPLECNFVMKDHGTVPFSAGSAFWLDVSNMHTVFNNSDQLRWHIIVHQSFDNVEFQQMVVNSYKILYNTHNETMHNTNPR